MVDLVREELEQTDEWILVSFMIMDDDVMANFYSRYKNKEIRVKQFDGGLRDIVRWCISYYKEYEQAPKRAIQRLFNKNRKKLGDDKEIVEKTLERLSDEYEEYQTDDSLDTEYVIRTILYDFIIEKKVERLKDQLEDSDPEEAEDVIKEYNATIKDGSEGDEVIRLSKKLYKEIEEESEGGKEAFRFPNILNGLVGPLEQGWLVAVTGVEKSGKSFLTQEIAFQAAIHQKKKVLIMNFELNRRMQGTRLLRRISGTTNREDAGITYVSIIDCKLNQWNKCKRYKRKKPLNKRPLFMNSDDTANYMKRQRWQICEKRCEYFEPAIWITTEKIRAESRIRISKAFKNEYYGMPTKNLSFICRPRFSTTFDEAKDIIRRRVDKTGEKFDIIAFDYLDILAHEGSDERISIDRIWKKAAGFAEELDCLIITPDQATKAYRNRPLLDQMSTTETKTKDAHLDVRLAINQTEQEMALGIVRFSVLFHRHKKFYPKRQILLTQKLATANPMVDCVYWYGSSHHPLSVDFLVK